MTILKQWLATFRRVCLVNPRLVLVLLVILIFLAMFTWTSPQPQIGRRGMVEAAQQSLTPTPAPSEMASPVPGPTAIPVEWQTNFNQTNGVVVGGVILVLIIIGGAIAVLAKPKGDNQPE